MEDSDLTALPPREASQPVDAQELGDLAASPSPSSSSSSSPLFDVEPSDGSMPGAHGRFWDGTTYLNNEDLAQRQADTDTSVVDEMDKLAEHQTGQPGERDAHSRVPVLPDGLASGSDNGLDSNMALEWHNEVSPSASEPELSKLTGGARRQVHRKIQVELPEVPAFNADEYVEVWSDTIEKILDERKEKSIVSYLVEYTDGREEVLSLRDTINTKNGLKAVKSFARKTTTTMDNSRKRKWAPDEDWSDPFEDIISDEMDLDVEEEEEQEEEEEEEVEAVVKRSSRRLRTLRSLREAQTLAPVVVPQSEDEDIYVPPARLTGRRNAKTLGRRNLRPRKPAEESMDELQRTLEETDSEEESTIAMITSDVAVLKGRPSRARKRMLRKGSKAASQRSNRTAISTGSDIEFEAPRRSGREKRNVNMRDDAPMDEDSFYVVDESAPAAPKAVSMREVFQPSDRNFSKLHMQECHSCGTSSGRSQLIHCQGCTLSFHRHCIGYRSGREHLATKIGEEDFVLQCRLCIDVHHKKDQNAPRFGHCQECHEQGKGCRPFSQKLTARQEEKLRDENGGTDPITPVEASLINSTENVLFRCISCRRAWHLDHLPSASGQINTVGTDLKAERLKDYAIDWHCNACNSVKHKAHRLVAWRPIGETSQGDPPAFQDVSEEQKEYLIKWEARSYRLCTWMPGSWVYGYVAPAMRIAFQKKAAEQNVLKMTEQEAIPQELLMPDVILNVKMSDLVMRRSRASDLANVSQVSRILVKFQGLGYDDVVWDSPPSEENEELYSAYLDAFHDFVEGMYFKSETNSKIRERVQEYQNAPFQKVDKQPPGLERGRLMNYQVEGLNWMLGNYHSQRSVVLADEMGLGKTVQVVSLITSLVQQRPKCWPFLIVVPNATCPNWRREFKQWAPSLRVVAYHGGKQSQELAYQHELFPNKSKDMKAHVVIMSYDSAQDPHTLVLFKYVQWQGLVVDEGQRLKNDQNLLYSALRRMKVPFRLLLTGTPLQNNKRELFNLIQFIDSSQNAEELDEEFAVLNKKTLPKLHEKIRPYFLRRTKLGVLKFLPPMSQIILPVTMTPLQSSLSKSIMAKNPQLIQSIFHNSKMKQKERSSLNNILMQLRKVLCHPFIYSEAIEEKDHSPEVMFRNLIEASSKLLLLKIMLPKLKERGHRVLIFSQFLLQLDIIEDFLVGQDLGYRRLDGSMESLEKQRRIDAFNAPESELFAFLLSTRAGGVGINLATADTVIIMDPDFNPHQDMQALSRAHRIGQKKKVLCFQLVTKNSVEEKIMQIGRKKLALDHALIEKMDDEAAAGDDLEGILRHGAKALFGDEAENAKQSIHYDSASVDKLLDRTQVEEEAEKADEGSGDTQFSYAKVWANEGSGGFEDNLGTAEEEAPEPLQSNVWDAILKEREAEAKKEAARAVEALGRGSRRRQAINYKTNQFETILEGAEAAESDESSDDFNAKGFDEDTDDDDDVGEAGQVAKGSKRRKFHSVHSKQLPTPSPSPVKRQQTKNRTSNSKPPKKPKPSTTTSPRTPTKVTRGSITSKQGPGSRKLSKGKGKDKDKDKDKDKAQFKAHSKDNKDKALSKTAQSKTALSKDNKDNRSCYSFQKLNADLR